jgi:hypothetical protein
MGSLGGVIDSGVVSAVKRRQRPVRVGLSRCDL